MLEACFQFITRLKSFTDKLILRCKEILQYFQEGICTMSLIQPKLELILVEWASCGHGLGLYFFKELILLSVLKGAHLFDNLQEIIHGSPIIILVVSECLTEGLHQLVFVALENLPIEDIHTGRHQPEIILLSKHDIHMLENQVENGVEIFVFPISFDHVFQATLLYLLKWKVNNKIRAQKLNELFVK